MIGQAFLLLLEWAAAALLVGCLVATATVNAWFAIPALVALLGALFARNTARTTAPHRTWGVGRAVADERGL